MEMKMRRARVEDAAAIRRIDQAMGGPMGLEIGQRPADYYKEWLAYHRGRRHPAFVGTSGGEVVWWVALGESPGGYPFDGVATVEMGVPQQYSGTELTDLLLRFLEQQAIKLGYYKLMACLNGEQRYLLHIYRRVGFRDVGILRSHGYLRGKLVDLVLLDIEMPKLNGIETFERMKEFAGDIPVIFLTASGQESDVVSAIRLGAVNYLKKPFEPQELIRRVAQELEEQ